MYLPKHFANHEVDTLHALIQAQPLATLINYSAEGLDANHIPLILCPQPLPQSPLGTLAGHVARANPLWKQAGETEVLAVFQGPQAYISPSWYPSKQVDGKVVPTWNYAVVHAHGKLRAIEDPTWLRAHLEAATALRESAFANPWRLTDAPRDYLDKMLAAEVGIEITITQLVGKNKISQNQPPNNRLGVVEGLRAQNTPTACAMADLVGAGIVKP